MKIRDLITQDKATLSFEVFPPKKDTDFADVEAAALGIAAFKPDYMSVTYGAGGSTKGHTIQLAQEIQEKYDVPTIAHLTCVCASKEGIKTALADMKNAGIENILALRGDIPKNYDGQVFAEFSHASELVELIKETGDFCVGGACYPEVHPDSANKHEDIIGLKKKVDAGCDYLTTQMFFDNNIFFRKNSVYENRYCSPSFGPGYYGMGMDTIPELLGLMDASQVGVSWNGERMSPKMSLVGTYLIAGEDVFAVDSDCRDCIGHSGGCEFCIKH